MDTNRVANSVTGNANESDRRRHDRAGRSRWALRRSRVRIELAQPVGHRVRSDRNTIVVDFDKPSLGIAGTTPGSRRAETPSVDPIAALGLGGTSQAVATAAVDAAPSDSIEACTTGAADRRLRDDSAARTGHADRERSSAPGSRGERRYTGHPVSLDFQGADLRAVLRTFAEISGLNIVIDPRVNGTVDVALRDVPWDQALDIILKANGLGYLVDGTIVRIAPLEALEAEQKKISDLAKAQAEAGQITTMTRQLSYAKGEDIVALLKAANVLSNRGTAFVDARTNTLIVTDLQERLTSTTQLLTTLDTPQPQVEIEARIVQANKNYSRALGIQWGFNGRVDPALGNTTPLAFPNSGNLGGSRRRTQGPPPVEHGRLGRPL